MSNWKIILLSIPVAFVLLIVPGFLRGIALHIDFGVSHAAYFLSVFLIVRKNPIHKTAVVLSFTLTIVGAFSLICLSANKLPLLALPNFSFMVVGCVFGYIFYIAKQRWQKMLLLSVSAIASAFYFFAGIHYWLNYCNAGTISGKVTIDAPANWRNYMDIKKDAIPTNTKQLIVLDFFNTRCGACFAAFPEVQKVYKKYKHDSRVIVYAVNIPYKADTPGMVLQLIGSRGYVFPIVIGKKGLDSLFEIKAYPTVLVLQNEQIIFRGSIDVAEGFLQKELTQ